MEFKIKNMRVACLMVLLFVPLFFFGQGMNSHWFLGHDTGFIMGRIEFDSTSYQLIQQQRKMTFRGTEATIANNQGNFFISSNGVWVANATGDTMMNGAGLNPGPFVNSNSRGLVIDNGNLIVPFPGDSNKFYLFHQTGTYQQTFPSSEIFYSIVDMSFDNGLGAVVSKNNIAIQDSISWGITACKHGNGRDWWIIAQKDSSNILYKILLTDNGIESITSQSLGYTVFAAGNAPQLTMSYDGSKIIQSNYDNQSLRNSSVIIADFDRCSGVFSNTRTKLLASGAYIWGQAFSPSGQYAYACTSSNIFQIDISTMDVDTVATYDGFCFPNAVSCTSFWTLYLAANGKIYITAGNGVQHIHEMNYPDSAGIACDVQQHSINLNGIWYLRAVPNHPNYYLGALNGSPCDTLGLGIQETNHDFHFTVSPNPVNGNFKISYLLPQNQKGRLEILDVNGKRVYEMNLPPWSTMQMVTLPKDICSGVYGAVLSSGGEGAYKKLVLIKE